MTTRIDSETQKRRYVFGPSDVHDMVIRHLQVLGEEIDFDAESWVEKETGCLIVETESSSVTLERDIGEKK